MFNKYNFFLAAITLMLITALTYIIFSTTEKNHVAQADGSESPIELMEWEKARYADPSTGSIPSQALWKAYRELIAQGKIPAAKFASQATTRTGEWQPVNDFFSSIAITKITYDPQQPQTFYFCTGEGWYNVDAAVGAGVWKSSDAGNTWAQLPATDTSLFSYCQDIDVHPLSSDVYVATSASGLMRSQDGGASFKKVLHVPGVQNNSICDVEFTKSGGIFATTGIFQAGAIYYSATGDSGTWVKQTNGFPTAGIFRVELATAPSNDSVAYAIACTTSTYGISGFYKTIDKGNTWFTIPDPGGDLTFAKKQAWYDMVLAVDPADENTVVAGGWQQWRSKDGGNTWFRLAHGNPDSTAYQYMHVDQHAILFRNSDTIYFGNDGGVWKSGNFEDDFPDIYERNLGYRVTQYYAGDIHPASGNLTIVGGTQDNGSNQMQNAGISPHKVLSGYDGGFCAINYEHPEIIYTTKNSNGLFRTTTGGYSIPDTITNAYLTDADVQFINAIALDPNDPELLYMASSSKGLWRLKNASTATDSSWERASKTIGAITAIGISKSQPGTVFIGKGSGGNVYRIEHADTTTLTHAWTDCDPQNNLPSGSAFNPVYCSCVYVDPSDVNHVFAVFSNYGIKNIWETKNATAPGATWISHDGDLPNMPVNWIFPHSQHPEVCYIATELGVFYTNNLNGDNTVWLPANQGLANVRVNMLIYRPVDQVLVAATHGRGMFTGTVPLNGVDFEIHWNERGPLDVGGRTRAIMIDPNDATGQTIWAGSVAGGLWKNTGIDALLSVNVEQPTVINQSLKVFPNPVSVEGTNILFEIPETKSITVYISDNSGKRIATLLDNKLSTAGLHNVKWIPSDELSNGIYYLCFVSGMKTTFSKMVFIR
ncbi:MAG: T9SS type A sorting domain-containing protein [Chitinophagales bacterium]